MSNMDQFLEELFRVELMAGASPEKVKEKLIKAIDKNSERLKLLIEDLYNAAKAGENRVNTPRNSP